MRLNSLKLSAFAAVLVALGTASCTDLTETPYNEVTQANFNPTAADLAALMSPAYTPLRQVWLGWYGMLDLQEERGDAFGHYNARWENWLVSRYAY